MKSYAGDLLIELHGDWTDESQYLYRDDERDIEVRVEPSPVDESATPEALLEPMLEKLELLGPLEDLRRDQATIQNRQGATLSLRCQREGDAEATLMQVLVFKTSPLRAITVTAFAPSRHHVALADAWKGLIDKIQVVDVSE